MLFLLRFRELKMHVSLFFNDAIDLYVLGLLSKRKKLNIIVSLNLGQDSFVSNLTHYHLFHGWVILGKFL